MDCAEPVTLEDEDKLEKIALVSVGSKNIGTDATKKYLVEARRCRR